MVFDPAEPRTLYLATEYAGIQKSTDSGETFRPLNCGFANHNLTQITGAGTHLYASSVYEGRFGGVFASNDGGLNWTLRANEEALAGRNLNSLAVAPARTELVFAASEEGVLKSTRRWKNLDPAAGPTEGRGSSRRQARGSLARARAASGAVRETNAVACGHGVRPVSQLQCRRHLGAGEGSGNRGRTGAGDLRATARRGAFGRRDSQRSVRVRGRWPDVAHGVSSGRVITSTTWRCPPSRDDPILAATSRGVLQSVDGGGTLDPRSPTAFRPPPWNRFDFIPSKSSRHFLFNTERSTNPWTAARPGDSFRAKDWRILRFAACGSLPAFRGA